MEKEGESFRETVARSRSRIREGEGQSGCVFRVEACHIIRERETLSGDRDFFFPPDVPLYYRSDAARAFFMRQFSLSCRRPIIQPRIAMTCAHTREREREDNGEKVRGHASKMLRTDTRGNTCRFVDRWSINFAGLHAKLHRTRRSTETERLCSTRYTIYV